MAEGCCGWNHSNSPAVPTGKQGGKRSVLKIVVVCAAFALMTAVICFLLSSREDNPADQSPIQSKNIANKGYKKLDEISRVKERKQYAEKPKSVNEALERVEEAQDPVMLEASLKVEDGCRTSKKVFATATEQVLSWLCHTELGEPPMPPPPLPDADMANLAQILISKNEIKDDDSPEAANAKTMVDAAKKEMMKFIRDGGNPDEFMQYVFREQKKAFETRNMTREMCDELLDEDPRMAREFAIKANEKLAEQGILPIEVPEAEGDADLKTLESEPNTSERD